jgi:hypothetical protein
VNNELVSYPQMNSSIHSVWCYGRKKKQVTKKILVLMTVWAF